MGLLASAGLLMLRRRNSNTTDRANPRYDNGTRSGGAPPLALMKSGTWLLTTLWHDLRIEHAASLAFITVINEKEEDHGFERFTSDVFQDLQRRGG